MGDSWKYYTLSDRSPSYKTTYYTIPFIWNVQIGKSMETESRLMIIRTRGEESEWECAIITKRNGVSFWGDENVLKSTVVMIVQLCKYTKAIKLYNLNRRIM